MDNLDSYFNSRIKIKDLKILALLGKYQSLTKVAQILHMTTSAISKALAEIETNYGSQLIRRETGKLTPLPECQILIESYWRIESELRNSYDKIAMMRGIRASKIIVGTQAPSLEDVITKAIIRFKDFSPKTEINIKTGTTQDLLTLLRFGEIDLLICRANVDDLGEDLRAILIHDYQTSIIASPNLEFNEQKQDLKHLLDYPWCLPSTASLVRQSFDATLLARGLKQPQNIVEVDNPYLVKNIFNMYDCLSISSSSLAKLWQQQGFVKVIKEELSFHIKPQIVIWNSKIPLNDNIKKFRDIICYESKHLSSPAIRK